MLAPAARYDDEQREVLEVIKAARGVFVSAAEWHEKLAPRLGQRRGRHPRATARRLANLAKAGVIERRPDPTRPGFALWGVSLPSDSGLHEAGTTQ